MDEEVYQESKAAEAANLALAVEQVVPESSALGAEERVAAATPERQRPNQQSSEHRSPGRNLMQSFSSHTTTRISMVWCRLSLSLITKDSKKSSLLRTEYKQKTVLQDISGKAQSGELLAIMGPTGCGKTSLMNILAARVTSLDRSTSKLDGAIYINGALRDDEKFRRVSAYVLQDDRLYPHLTVSETLTLAAHFFLPDAVTDKEKDDLVTSVLTELGLVKVRNTIVGNEKVRGVSGGERKRANIAVQLISNPSVLFLDEPTSGLDSFQSLAVMESMKNMAIHGRLVISVIHQPRSSIYDMFDKILLLSEGRVMYMGHINDVDRYFQDIGHPLPRFFNPADFFLDVLSPDVRTAELDEATRNRIVSLAEHWQQQVDVDALMSSRGGQGLDSEQVPTYHLTFPRFVRNFRLLFWRSFSETVRNRPAFMVRMFTSILFSCIIGGMYNNLGDTQTSIYNRQGMLFIIVLNQAFNAVITVSMSFPNEKVIVNRERSANAYDTISYYVAKFFAELPSNLIPGFIFGTIIYWIAGLRAERYGIFVLILLLEIVTAATLGMAIGAVSSSGDMATNIAVPIVIIAFIFAGFYINLSSLPPVAEWVPYSSFLRWAFQALCINEFEGQTFTCSDEGGNQCLATGEQVLESLSFQRQSLQESVLGLSMVFVICLIAAIVLLDMNRLTFLPLSHEGRKHRQVVEQLAGR